jgi:hypothetical protein
LIDDSLAARARAGRRLGNGVAGLRRTVLNLGFRVVGAPEGMRNTIANVSYVTPRFFDTLRIGPARPGVHGDRSHRRCRSSPSTKRSRGCFCERGAVGRRLRLSGAEREIVGIVGDVQLERAGFF